MDNFQKTWWIQRPIPPITQASLSNRNHRGMHRRRGSCRRQAAPPCPTSSSHTRFGMSAQQRPARFVTLSPVRVDPAALGVRIRELAVLQNDPDVLHEGLAALARRTGRRASAMSAEVAELAQNIARHLGWAVFPCGWESKAPTRPKSEGGNGFKDATRDPDEIAELWRRWPGELIGIVTGQASGINVLDIDAKHPISSQMVGGRIQARAAKPHLSNARRRLSPSISSTLQGSANTQSKLAHGVDSRGDGGYAIFWYTAGFECLKSFPPSAMADLVARLSALATPDSRPTRECHQPQACRQSNRGRAPSRLNRAGRRAQRRPVLGRVPTRRTHLHKTDSLKRGDKPAHQCCQEHRPYRD